MSIPFKDLGLHKIWDINFFGHMKRPESLVCNVRFMLKTLKGQGHVMQTTSFGTTILQYF